MWVVVMHLNLRIFFKSCFDHDISTGLSSAVDSWDFNQTTFWRNNNITFISIIVTRVYMEILAWSTNWHQCSSLRWRHNGRDGVSNHQPHGCLLQPFIQTQIKENIKPQLCFRVIHPSDRPVFIQVIHWPSVCPSTWTIIGSDNDLLSNSHKTFI